MQEPLSISSIASSQYPREKKMCAAANVWDRSSRRGDLNYPQGVLVDGNLQRPEEQETVYIPWK